MQVVIELPKFWKRVLHSCGSNRPYSYSIIHAALDVRALESMMAIALSAPDVTAVIIPKSKLARAKYLFKQWMPEEKLEAWDGAAFNFDRMWITTDFETIPIEVEQALIPFAHELEDQPKNLPQRVIAAGILPQPGHWFVAWSTAADSQHKINAEGVIKEFRDQQRLMLPTSHPMYSQHMLCEYATSSRRMHNFSAFAKDRLFIRSDKRPEYMTARQQEHARAQLGDAWSSARPGVAIGTPIVPFELSSVQRRYLAMKRLGRKKGFRKFLLLKYRRGGFTTLEQAESYALVSECSNSHVITLAHTLESTQRIFRMVDTYHEKDPRAIQRVGDSKTRLELANGSYFFIGTAGGKSVSRGDTLARVHGSEVSRWCMGPRQMELVAELIAGLSGAASNGEIVLETTPNGHEFFHSLYVDAKNGLNDYWPIFIRWFDDPGNVAPAGSFSESEILDTLTEREKELVALHDLSVAQIAFRRAAEKAYRRLMPQELPEDDASCFLSSGHCYFDTPLLIGYLHAGIEKPLSSRHVPGGVEEIFEAPQPSCKYAAGCDTSEGIPGCDPNGVGIVRVDSGKQVAHVHGLFKPTTLAEHAVRLCRTYNNALLGVERENHGHAVLQEVIRLGYSRSHNQGGSLYYFKDGRPGWSTNEQTRVEMLTGLDSFLCDGGLHEIRDTMFLNECLTFNLQTSGKFEADPGAHDDSVMKWALAYRMRKERPRKLHLTVVEDD